MRAPDFWHGGHSNFKALFFWPIGLIFKVISYVREKFTRTHEMSAVILCVGNVVMGGAGKTPVCIDIGKRFVKRKVNVNYLSRGYGGTKTDTHLVDPDNDLALSVGDEPIILSKVAPTWVSRDRVKGAKASIDSGAQVIIMDDGFQHPRIKKNFSILVVDTVYGFGNGHVFPAGPLRETPENALNRSDLVVLLGPDESSIKAQLLNKHPKLPILSATIIPGPELNPHIGKPMVAFSGIANPDKFFSTLVQIGCNLLDTIKFSDHHLFTEKELAKLHFTAKQSNSVLVTTEKDWVRLPVKEKKVIKFLTISLQWDDEAFLNSILDQVG